MKPTWLFIVEVPPTETQQRNQRACKKTNRHIRFPRQGIIIIE